MPSCAAALRGRPGAFIWGRDLDSVDERPAHLPLRVRVRACACAPSATAVWQGAMPPAQPPSSRAARWRRSTRCRALPQVYCITHASLCLSKSRSVGAPSVRPMHGTSMPVQACACAQSLTECQHYVTFCLLPPPPPPPLLLLLLLLPCAAIPCACAGKGCCCCCCCCCCLSC